MIDTSAPLEADHQSIGRRSSRTQHSLVRISVGVTENFPRLGGIPAPLDACSGVYVYVSLHLYKYIPMIQDSIFIILRLCDNRSWDIRLVIRVLHDYIGHFG